MIKKILPSGEQVTAFPISAPQQFMYYMSAQYGASFPVNNIGMAYFIHGKIDEKKMKEALYEAIERCDTMRLRFTRDEKYRILQYITDRTESVIDTIDMSGIPFEEAKKKLRDMSRKALPVYDCEIHRIALVRFKDGINGIYMLLHHFAADAYSVSVFLRDALDIYAHKTEGKEYPKPMRAYIPVLMKELSYLSSPEREEDKEYWFNSLAAAEEPVFTDYLLESRLKEQRKAHPCRRFADIHSGSPEADALIFSISAEESKEITDACEKHGLSVCAFLSMGVRTALSIFNDNEKDISFKMIVNRRGSIAEKKSGGIRINFFPMRSIINPDMTFIQAVKKIEEIQSDIYCHCSLSFMEILAERHKSMPADALADSTYDSVGFSYQPPHNIPRPGGHFCESEWFNNGASMIPLYLTVKHRTGDNGFDFIFEYRKDPDPYYDIHIFFNKLKNALLDGARYPEMKTEAVLTKEALTNEERNGKNG